MASNSTKYISPFKWTGSKSKEIKKIRDLLGQTNLRICEPFMGTGVVTAVFGQDGACVGNDLNEDIYNLLMNHGSLSFRKDVEEYMTREHMSSYDYFYEMRAKFNQTPMKMGADRAAMFFFLQNCSHFGLYRLNPKGEYTSTWHFFDKEPKLAERLASLDVLSAKLDSLYCLPYRDFISMFGNTIQNDLDLVFMDPPYLNASHKDYSVGKGAFTIEDYQTLDDWAGYLAKRGVRSIICNYSTPDDDIIYPNAETIVKFSSSRSMRLNNFIQRQSIYVLYGFGNSLL